MSHQVLATDHWPLFDIRATLLTTGGVRLHVSLDLLIADALELRRSSCASWRASTTTRTRAGAAGAVLPRLRARGLEQSSRAASYRRAQAYWRERLHTLPPAPALPLARPPASVREPRFVRRSGRCRRGRLAAASSAARSAPGSPPRGARARPLPRCLAALEREPALHAQPDAVQPPAAAPAGRRLVGDFTSIVLLAVDLGERRVLRRACAPHPGAALGGPGPPLLQRRARAARAGRAAPATRCGPAAGRVHQRARPDGGRTPARRCAGWARALTAITQTPQVWLDHQVIEDAGGLLFNWDAVEELFPPGLLDDMFERLLPPAGARWRDEAAGLGA